jgi:hypothetical protein
MHMAGGDAQGGGGVGGCPCILCIPPGHATESLTKMMQIHADLDPAADPQHCLKASPRAWKSFVKA